MIIKTASVVKTYITREDELFKPLKSGMYGTEEYPITARINTDVIDAIEYPNNIGYLAAAGCFVEA